ncbi:MAG: glycosyltransferase family 2 protein [Bacteroidales bacterium]
MPLSPVFLPSPLVTLYILNFNYGEYIVQAIESAINQTFSNFELIIIDDGSTDNSKDKIKPYEGKVNITVVYQSNKGLTTSANVALKLARGKYFIRLDADDWFELKALEELVNEFLFKKDTAYVFPDYWLTDKMGHDIRDVSAVELFPNNNPSAAPPHGACTLIQTNILKSNGGYNETLVKHDGTDLYQKLLHEGAIVHLKQRLFHYRQHGRNLSF